MIVCLFVSFSFCSFAVSSPYEMCVCVCICAISGYCLLVICIKTYYHYLLDERVCVCVLICLIIVHTRLAFFSFLLLFSYFFVCSFLFFLRNFKLCLRRGYFFLLVNHSFRDRVVMFVISYDRFIFYSLSPFRIVLILAHGYGSFIHSHTHTLQSLTPFYSMPCHTFTHLVSIHS